MSDQFMIKWFRENTAGAVEDLGLGDPEIFMSNKCVASTAHTGILHRCARVRSI